MTYDYVIVGAGTAGCLLANRLSADPSVNVLLVEAGGRDDYFWIRAPLGLPYLLGNPRFDWCYQSEPEPGANGRRFPVPRGKVLGGSSSINAMCYIRGHRRDFDEWREAGNAGWGWDEVLPYFKRFEDFPRGADEAHGAGGELHVSAPPPRWEILEAVRAATVELGMPQTDDHNRGDNEGCGYFHFYTRNGARWSAADAFLRPAMKRPNLTVMTGAHVARLKVDGGRASGVVFRTGGEQRSIEARREVVLAAGAIGSPQLLQLSGIGPASLLKEHGIDVIHHLPGVGENMQDHWQIRCTYRVRNTVTLNDWVTNPLRKYAMGAAWLFARRGPMCAPPPQLCAFTRSDAAQELPNLQYHFTPASSQRAGGPLDAFPGFSCGIAVVRPAGAGHVRIRSRDPHEPPAILHNFLADAASQRVAVDAIRLTRRLVASRALARFEPQEQLPGERCASDEEILAYARSTVWTVFHQSCTCRMGRDAMAVVDERLRVRGVAGLRVVDASVMPSVVRGNTNAAAMMIAEKGAEMIRADAR